MTQQEKLELQTISRKCRLCLIGSIVLVVVLSLGKMTFLNRSATWGGDWEAVKRQTEKIKRENLLLQSQLAQQTGGLDKLRQTALELGFTEKVTVKYLTPAVSVAQKLP